MSYAAILLLAIGLAMDAMTVSVARGVVSTRISLREVLLVAGFFGGFQAAMPAVGWLIGSQLGPEVERWGHWIAFALLVGIGGKMLWESRRSRDDDANARDDVFALKTMTLLALATSIDALAAGITLPLLDAPFAVSLLTIGATTALLSGAGLIAGRRFGALIGKRLDVAGGLVLIGLGTKILIERLWDSS